METLPRPATPSLPRHTLLPGYLTLAYGLLIIYASLQPFVGWTNPVLPFFLWTPSTHETTADILLNVVAYFPFGFFATLVPRLSVRAFKAFVFAVCLAGGLSFAMEWTQMYLPARVASSSDLATNIAGASLGALCALELRRHVRWRRWLVRRRERLFRRGSAGDLGLALLAVWLLVQVNPGIPLFAATFNPDPRLTPDRAGTAIQAAQTLFNVVGVGLFVAVLLRNRQHVWRAIALFIGAALLCKGIAAALLLKPSFSQQWIGTPSALGLAVGCLLLIILSRLPRAAQSLICSVALLSALGTQLFAPDLILMRAPLFQFSWSYGQLLNFNGLTHAALLAWPLAASLYLFVLAGHKDHPEHEAPPSVRV